MEIQSEKDFVEKINLFRIVFAIMIVLGHCSMRFENELFPLWVIHKFDMVGVCYFFFASGLSCAFSYGRKSESIFHYSLRKIVSLVAVVLICLAVTVFIDLIFRNESVLSFDFIFNNINWYVWVQIFFYVVLFFAYKFFENSKGRVIFVTACAIVEIMATYFQGSNYNAWYYSSLGFPMGILFHEYFDRLNNSKHTSRIIIISALIMVLSCSCLFLPENFFTGVVMRNTMACCFMLIFVYLLLKIISKSAMDKLYWLKGLSNYSTEIYLYQFIILSAIAELFAAQERTINMEYVVAVLILTIVIAYFMNMIDKKVTKSISRLI